MHWWIAIGARYALFMDLAAGIVHGEARGQDVPEPVTGAGVTYESLELHATPGARTIRFLAIRDTPQEVLRIDPNGLIRGIPISEAR